MISPLREKWQPRWLWCLAALLAACAHPSAGPRLVVAVNAGVEGDALKRAAADYQQVSGVGMEIVELPYANLF